MAHENPIALTGCLLRSCEFSNAMLPPRRAHRDTPAHRTGDRERLCSSMNKRRAPSSTSSCTVCKRRRQSEHKAHANAAILASRWSEASQPLQDCSGSDTCILHACAVRSPFLGLFILIHTQSIAGDTTLLSIGPRYGFSRKDPLLGNDRQPICPGRRRRPLQASLVMAAGGEPLECRDGTDHQRGALSAAGATGFIATVVPRVALSGWNGFASIDAGLGLGLFGRDHYGPQDFGGHVQLVLTTALQSIRSLMRLRDFACSTSQTQASMVLIPLGVDLYIIEVGYRF